MEMTENELEALLQKYYDGETSLEEETRLMLLMNPAKGAPVSGADQKWFEHLQAARKADTRGDFQAKAEEKILADKELNSRSIVWVSARRWLSGMAAVLVLGAGISYLLYRIYPAQSDGWIEKSASLTGQTHFSLPDGSGIWLNKGSKLRYPDQFGEATREVWLEGEAFFEVTRDARKPFLVHTPRSVTRVTGTSFNVRSYPGEEKVSVIVLSGQVILAPDSGVSPEKVYLNPGNEGIFDGAASSVQRKTESDPNRVAWKTHRLVFSDQPLGEIIPVLEEYFGVQITAKDPALLHCRFRGTFPQAKMEDILQVMAFSMNITTRQSGEQYTLTGRGCSK